MSIPIGSASESSNARCWRCSAPIDRDDLHCRRCGEGQGAAIRWYYRPAWMLVLALTVLGPFVLPLIWRTPHLGRTAKWIASLAVIAVTAYVGWQLAIAVGQLASVLNEL